MTILFCQYFFQLSEIIFLFTKQERENVMTTLSFSTGEFARKTIRKLTSITEQMSLLSVKIPDVSLPCFLKQMNLSMIMI